MIAYERLWAIQRYIVSDCERWKNLEKEKQIQDQSQLTCIKATNKSLGLMTQNAGNICWFAKIVKSFNLAIGRNHIKTPKVVE